MGYGKTFYNLCSDLKIGNYEHNRVSGKNDFYIKNHELLKLISKNTVFDASKGGLIIGNLHSDGGIHLLQKNNSGLFKYLGEMEGGEYITKPVIEINDISKIEELNKKYFFKTKLYFHPGELPHFGKIINVSEVEVPILILSNNSQFIINRFSTYLKYNEIIEIENNA